jgi:hypothetical protein
MRQEACCSSTLFAEEDYYGGTPFIFHDTSTHWTEPHQLYTWWKNNIERKSKYKILQKDATYCGLDQRRAARARWCAVVVAMVEVIRDSPDSAETKTNPQEQKTIGSPEVARNRVGLMPYKLPSVQNLLRAKKEQFAPVPVLSDGFPYFDGLDGGDPISLIKNLTPSDTPGVAGYGVPHSKTNLLSVQQLLLRNSQNINPKRNEDFITEALAHKRELYQKRIDQIKALSSQSDHVGHKTFPLKLYDLVTEQNNDIIGWLPDGHGFQVIHLENFENIILPAYFKRRFSTLCIAHVSIDANFVSFQRQLNLYGFRRTKASEKGAYSHINFQSGRRDLVSRIRRIPTSKDLEKKISESFQITPNLTSITIQEPILLEQTTPPKNGPKRRAKSPNLGKTHVKKVAMVKQSPKESELYAFNRKPRHDYGTRRKRLKKQFDEFIIPDDLFKRKRKNNDRREENPEVSQPSSECDEFIDMTSTPHQRRRLTTRLILIDMTPTLNRRSAVVNEWNANCPNIQKEDPNQSTSLSSSSNSSDESDTEVELRFHS